VEGSCEHGNEPSGSIILENSWVAAQLAASQEGLSFIELVTYVLGATNLFPFSQLLKFFLHVPASGSSHVSFSPPPFGLYKLASQGSHSYMLFPHSLIYPTRFCVYCRFLINLEVWQGSAMLCRFLGSLFDPQMEAVRSSETSANSYQSTLRNMPDDIIFHSYRLRTSNANYKNYFSCFSFLWLRVGIFPTLLLNVRLFFIHKMWRLSKKRSFSLTLYVIQVQTPPSSKIHFN
jgi:hypothetical protein